MEITWKEEGKLRETTFVCEYPFCYVDSYEEYRGSSFKHIFFPFLFFRISTSPENSGIFIEQHLSTTRPVGIDKLIIRFAVEETANLIAAFISPLCELISTVRYLAKMAR